MGSKMDETKGRAKEAAGAATNDKDMEREGKLDQAGASIKETFEGAKTKMDETVDKLKDKFSKK